MCFIWKETNCVFKGRKASEADADDFIFIFLAFRGLQFRVTCRRIVFIVIEPFKLNLNKKRWSFSDGDNHFFWNEIMRIRTIYRRWMEIFESKGRKMTSGDYLKSSTNNSGREEPLHSA